MSGNLKDGTGRLAVMACDGRQHLSDGVCDSRLRPAEDPNLLRLRQTFNELSPAVSWQDMRSRILAALSDLPDEPRPCPPLLRHLPAPAHARRRQGRVIEGYRIAQRECLQPESRDSARLPALCFSRLLRLPRENHKIVWTLSVIAIAIVVVLLLLRPHRSAFAPQFSPTPPAGSGVLATLSQGRATQPERMPPAAAKAPASITAVRTDFEPASAAVVISLTQPVQYEVHRLASPERVYIDFHNARLLPQLQGRSVGEGKPCLRKYRLAPRARQTVRIAFETSTACSYSAELTAAPSISLVLRLRPIPSPISHNR